ncbi:hypothetical protein, partial [Streptomyces acidiscabies]|uniref:hypothetical protein n=1 Tax=Streptomyces acidiscabies TaxID=42234 RepID=UPI0015B7BBEA
LELARRLRATLARLDVPSGAADGSAVAARIQDASAEEILAFVDRDLGRDSGNGRTVEGQR